MWNWFKKKNRIEEEEYISVWKSDFSDCVAADYLPSYSFCQNENHATCRYVARYAGVTLCSNPQHKSFIPKGAERYNPQKAKISD